MEAGAVQKHQYVADSFFCLRCPALPFSDYEDLGAGLSCADLVRSDGHQGDAEQAFINDCRTVRLRMQKMVERPMIQEALRVSSPDIVDALRRWYSDPMSKSGASVERGLLKYLIRSMSRCTPFGTLAGVAQGIIATGAETDIRLAGPDAHRRNVRPDAQVLLAVAHHMTLVPELRRKLSYRANTTLYRCGSRFRYFEADIHPYSARRRLVSIGISDVVLAVKDAASGGASWEKLAAAVVTADENAEPQEIDNYLDALVGSQFLVADVYPSVSGRSMLQDLIERLRAVDAPARVREALAKLDYVCADLSRAGGETDAGAMSAACRVMHSHFKEAGIVLDAGSGDGDAADDEVYHPDEVSTGSRSWFQVDLVLDAASAVLARRELEPILSAVDALVRLQSQAHLAPLEEFAIAFDRKYGGRLVPVSEALDPDGGIPFGSQGRRQVEPSPLLRVPIGTQTPQYGKRGPLDSWLTRLAFDAARNQDWQINLSSRAIAERFPQMLGNLPDSSVIMASRLAGIDPEHADRPSWYLLNTSGVHTLTLLGRFAQVLDSPFVDNLQRCARFEQAVSRDCLFEVRYLPPGRLGNVCQQPGFREHAIPYLSPPGPDSGSLHDVEDLYLLVHANRLFLWSARLGCFVKPRIDHALNVSHDSSPALFNFFGMLQVDGCMPSARWTWEAAAELPDLPRVTIDGVLVSRRIWNLGAEEVEKLCGGKAKGNFETHGFSAFRRVQDWRRDRSVPRWVSVGSSLDYMTVDLDNPLTVGLFLNQIRSTRSVCEALAVERARGVQGCGGGHVNEFVIPVWNAKHVTCEEPLQVASVEMSVPFKVVEHGRDVRYTAEGVLQAKIYGGETRLEHFLRGELGAFLDRLRRGRPERRWFFIRYSDPDFHLRLRIFGPQDELLARVMPELENLVNGPAGHGLQQVIFDGYQPEYQRYGGVQGVARAEELFCTDSSFVLDLIRLQAQSAAAVLADLPAGGVEGRWLLAVLSADMMLGDFGFDLTNKLAFTAAHLERLTNRQPIALQQRKRVGELSRQSRELFAGLLEKREDLGLSWVSPCRELLESRSRVLTHWTQQLREDIEDGRVPRMLRELVGSYFHMHCNRIFQSQMRRQEIVLVHLLQRAYRAQMGRADALTGARDSNSHLASHRSGVKDG